MVKLWSAFGPPLETPITFKINIYFLIKIWFFINKKKIHPEFL